MKKDISIAFKKLSITSSDQKTKNNSQNLPNLQSQILSVIYVIRSAICYHFYNLKNVKNSYGGVLLLVQLQDIYNSTKISDHTNEM